MVQMNLFAKQTQRHRCREKTYGYQGGMDWEIGIDIYTTMYKIMTNENLLQSTENSIHYSVVTEWEENPKKGGYVYRYS